VPSHSVVPSRWRPSVNDVVSCGSVASTCGRTPGTAGGGGLHAVSSAASQAVAQRVAECER
jgi:hypothetical protein